MNNNFNITLDDVKDFLSTLGYAWNGAIILNGGCGCAEDLSDFNNNREMLTSMRLHTPEGAMIKDVMITGISFTFYNKSLDHSDIDATMEYEVEKDHTEQWIQFLLQRYGNNYRNYVKKLCKRMKH